MDLHIPCSDGRFFVEKNERHTERKNERGQKRTVRDHDDVHTTKDTTDPSPVEKLKTAYRKAPFLFVMDLHFTSSCFLEL